MAAMRVVPALDEVEHRDARLGLGLEAPRAEQLAFQGGKDPDLESGRGDGAGYSAPRGNGFNVAALM